MHTRMHTVPPKLELILEILHTHEIHRLTSIHTPELLFYWRREGSGEIPWWDQLTDMVLENWFIVLGAVA